MRKGSKLGDPTKYGIPSRINGKPNPEYNRLEKRDKYQNSPAQREQVRAYDLKKTFGLTLEAYASILEAQHGVCAICSGPQSEEGRMLAVDHSHATGKIRGLLCGNCNRGLGMFKDQEDLLLRAVLYLKNSA